MYAQVPSQFCLEAAVRIAADSSRMRLVRQPACQAIFSTYTGSPNSGPSNLVIRLSRNRQLITISKGNGPREAAKPRHTTCIGKSMVNYLLCLWKRDLYYTWGYCACYRIYRAVFYMQSPDLQRRNSRKPCCRRKQHRISISMKIRPVSTLKLVLCTMLEQGLYQTILMIDQFLLASRAPFRSYRRSSRSSTPDDKRIMLSVMPSLALCQAGTPPWVMTAGSSIKLSTPPRLSARVMTWTALRNLLACSNPPLIQNVTIPPNPLICFLAISCCGCSFNPGQMTFSISGCLARQCAIWNAFLVASWTRRAMVLCPRMAMQQSKGLGHPPKDFALRNNWSFSSSELKQSVPMITSECPLMYLLHESQAISTPRRIGLNKKGLSKVVSQTVVI